MSNVARGSGAGWQVSPNTFDIETGNFAAERDTASAMFYMKEDVGPDGELRQVEMVEIRGPGESLNVYGGKVRDEDRKRFRAAYEAFKRGEEVTNGTPLSKWEALSNLPQLQAQLRAFGYYTVEQLAAMPDGGLHEFHGSLTWRKKAQDFIAKQAKIEQAAGKENLEQQLAELRAQIAAMSQENAPKKRGPKPKTESVAA